MDAVTLKELIIESLLNKSLICAAPYFTTEAHQNQNLGVFLGWSMVYKTLEKERGHPG